MIALLFLLAAAFVAGPLVLVVAARRGSGPSDVSGLDRLDGVGREQR